MVIMAMKTWRCKKCGHTVRAMGTEAYHGCPKSRKNERMEEVSSGKPKL